MRRRAILLAAALLPAAPAGAAEPWDALRAGGVVLFRHAHAPGGGDPPGMRLGDCATQRNLDDTGRAQARRIGATLRSRQVPVGAVLASQWCRTLETAALAFPGAVREEPAFNSFFADRAQEAPRTAAARQVLAGWTGPGALVVVTHQVNILALTGISPSSGEGVVLRRDGEDWWVAGTLRP